MEPHGRGKPARIISGAYYPVAGLLALCAVTLICGLGRLPLVGPEEPRYAEVAREMFVSSDYISPRLCAHLLFEKPVLLFWGAAAAYHAVGVNEFGARLPSALAAIVCTFFLYHTIASSISSRLALTVSTVLATSALFIVYARAAVTDMLLAATICVAINCFYLCTIKTSRARSIYWALGWAAAGAAVLAKGLIGGVLILAILAISRVTTHHSASIGWREIVFGLLIFLAVTLIWYLPVTVENGRVFINEFFVNQHFKRYLTDRYSHPQPIWFFPEIILASVAPWTFFLVPAVGRLFKKHLGQGSNQDYLLALAWIWLLTPLVFFSLSKSKLPGYMLPALPALAIIVGVEVERVWRDEEDRLLSIALWLTAGLVILIGLALPVYMIRERIVASPLEAIVSWIPLTIGLVAIAAQLIKKAHAVIIGAVAVVSSIVILAVPLMSTHLDDRLSQKRLALTAASALRQGEKIAIYMDKHYASVFYAQGRVVYDDAKGEGLSAFTLEEILESVQTYGSVIVLTPSAYERDLVDDKRLYCELVGRQGTHSAFRVSFVPAHT